MVSLSSPPSPFLPSLLFILPLGLWETIPEGWEKTKEIKRYTKGRILLIGPPDLFGELVSFCPSTNLVYVLPLYPSSDSSSPLVPMGIPLPKILALNQRHGFPIFGKDLIMEDGIRCRFSSPLTKGSFFTRPLVKLSVKLSGIDFINNCFPLPKNSKNN